MIEHLTAGLVGLAGLALDDQVGWAAMWIAAGAILGIVFMALTHRRDRPGRPPKRPTSHRKGLRPAQVDAPVWIASAADTTHMPRVQGWDLRVQPRQTVRSPR